MGNVPWCVTVLCAAFFLLAGPAHADDICSEAAGGECEAAQEIVDMARDNPVVDFTGEPDNAQAEIDSQPDAQGDSDAEEEDE